MKKNLILALLFSSLLGVDGYDVYKKNCASCHAESMSRDEAKRNIKTLKAPPMVEVSNRLKENISISDGDEDVKRRVVIAFIKDYIVNPNIDYSMCHMGALERFDVMPSLKGTISDDEKDAVSTWVYDRYENVKF
ncbi:MAG: cytochrome c [Campylobacterota bacterium]|nr:cytochrome c [Campylobacterota bacterium]